MDKLQVIGQTEVLDFPELGVSSVPARIDTGAQTSALFVSKITLEEGKLVVVLFDKNSPHYSGKSVVFDNFKTTVVYSSNGQNEERYKVRTLVLLKGRKIRASFTLADRSKQVYPVLIGRNVLSGKFVVDVKVGRLRASQEKENAKARRRNNKQSKEEGR